MKQQIAMYAKKFKPVIELAIIQMISAVTPVVISPILAGTLGVIGYSQYAVAINAIAIAVAVGDFGIQQWATEVVSGGQPNKNGNRAFHVDALGVRAIFALCVGFIIYTYFHIIDFESFFVRTIIVAIIFIQLITPIWIYYGSAQFSFILICTFISRAIFFAVVVYFVHNNNDLDIAFLSLLLMYFSVFLIVAINSHPIFLGCRGPSWLEMRRIILVCAGYFTSRTATLIANYGGVVFLAVRGVAVEISHFAIAQMIYFGLQACFYPISQAALPSMMRHPSISKITQLAIGCFLTALVISVIGAYFTEEVILLFFGADFKNSAPLVEILLIAFVINVPSVVIGYPLFSPFSRADIPNKSVVFGLLCSVAFIFWALLIFHSAAEAIAWGIVVFESGVLLFRLYFLKKLFQPTDPDKHGRA